jgi:alcohol dehydrogenase (cytochrome c)
MTMKTIPFAGAMCAALMIAATWTLSGQTQAGQPVTYQRLLNADQEPGNWLMYSGGYNGWRFSRLNQITAQNAKNLRVKWLFQGRHNEKFETTPLVVDGIMYLTRPENAIYALDALTGRQLWMYEHRNPERTFNCCGRVNRGLAILGTTLFMNTLDMHIIAVDAKSGRELWKTKMFDHMAAGGYAAPGAPLVVKDKLIVGMAGGERGVSGFLDAYDPKTGERLWRFNTIPQPGDPNFGTWAGDSWKTGGASTWNTGAYDPDTNTLFWGTSNPWPDYFDDQRAGDNLYSASVLALDPDTGKLKWFYQFTPHDTHDWDSTQNPVLVDTEFLGQTRKVLAWPNRNGFFYLIDRTNGKFLSATAFVKQTWNDGFDYENNGRPKLVPGMDPTPDGNDKVWPGIDGGANWMAHSYSPLTKLLYVFAREERRVFTKNEVPHPTTDERPDGPGAGRGGGGGRAGRPPRFAPEESWGKAIAIDPKTGAIKWEHKVVTAPWGGLMSTAGNLVFGGTMQGVIFALNATTGERLFTFASNGAVYGTAISYLADGKQLVSIPAGDLIVTLGLD